MSKEEEDFLKKLRSAFKVEAEEHLKGISSGLLELEKTSSAEEQMLIIETVFREAHSLKGAARSVSLMDVEVVCQSLESVFAAMKSEKITPSLTLFDVLHKTADAIGGLIFSPEAEQTADISELIQQLVRAEADELESGTQPDDHQDRQVLFRPKRIQAQVGLPEETQQSEEADKETEPVGAPAMPPQEKRETIHRASSPSVEGHVLSETVRISAPMLDSLLLQAEEMLSAKLATSGRAADLRGVEAMLAPWRREWKRIHPAMRIVQQSLEREEQGEAQVEVVPQVAKLVEFADWTHTYMESFEGELARLAKSAEDDQRLVARMVDNLLEDMKNVLVLPFSTLLEIFPKLVRDLSRDQGKEVDLVISGEEIEIDKRILEIMKTPLIHLVRNCIDHGVQTPEEREQSGKPRRGYITLDISQVDSGKVEIVVSDDGSGIDVEKVKEEAVRRGVISKEEARKLDEQESLWLIFQSDVTTSAIITDISGRGLGLPIVREKVEELGGVILVETQPDVGTSFRMVLPLMLATFRGILVRLADRLFVIPVASIERTVRVKKDEVKTVENRESIVLNGSTISLVRLDDVLELPRRQENDSEFIQVLILGAAEKRIAFDVDEILNEQEVLVKDLGGQLSRVRNISGATVLGSGKVVPVLNIPDLMKSAVKTSATLARAIAAAAEAEVKRKSVLVVEDSITSRMLLKNILESAGYDVSTTIDGVDAFTALREHEFDLVVSDVEMPRMNGFELTSRIRSHEKLADMPVVLVTALGSREDREHGIDAGANAYIVKASFDRSNLLDAVRRLIS